MATTALAPSTVDAFIAAPEAKQKDALAKMSVDAKQALLAALKARKDAGTLKPAQTPAPAPATPPSASNANSSPTLDAKPTLGAALQKTGQDVMHDIQGTPVGGFVKSARQTAGGLLDITSKYLRHESNPYAVADYMKQHPGASKEDAMKAVSPVAQKLQGLADVLNKDTNVHGIMEGAGALAEMVAELMVPESWFAKAGEAVKGGEEAAELAEKAKQTAKWWDKAQESADKLVTQAEQEYKLAPTAENADALKRLKFYQESIPNLREVQAENAKRMKGLPKLVISGLKEGGKAAAEQGTQEYVHSGGDVDAAREAAEFGGVAGGLTPATVEVLGAGNQFLKDALRRHFKINEFDTDQLVRETAKINKTIEERAERVRATNKEKIDDYNRKVKEAQDAANKANATADEKAAADKAEHEAEVNAARLEHQNQVIKQQALVTERATRQKTVLQLRNRLATRLFAIQNAAKGYFERNYADIAEKIGNRSVPLEDVADAVHDSLPKIEGSEESVKPFKDIISKLKKLSVGRAEGGLSEEQMADLDPDEREMLRKDEQEHGTESGVSFNDLKGYYSEAGRLLASESVPGDVKQALLKFREEIDNMQQKLADEAGVGARYKLLRNQYKKYAEGFLDYQGPNKSGSPVAISLKGADPYHQTQPLWNPKLQPEEISRIRQILAGSNVDASSKFVEGEIPTPSGKMEPAWRYRKDSVKLLDNLREQQAKLDALPKPKNIEPFDESKIKAKPAKATEPKQPKEIKKPTLLKEPKIQTLTPDQLAERKRQIWEKQVNNLGSFGTWVVMGGLVGGITALFTKSDPERAIEEIVGGGTMGLLAPHFISRALETPAVTESLTKVTRGDLEKLAKLPPAQRGNIEKSIKELADAAVKKGMLKRGQIPWYRVLGGEAGKAMSGADEKPDQTVLTDQDLNQISRQLNQMEDQP